MGQRFVIRGCCSFSFLSLDWIDTISEITNFNCSYDSRHLVDEATEPLDVMEASCFTI